jgi:hypothetical protein
MYAPQPPTWLIFAALLALAVPSSAVFGLLAAWLFDRFYRRRDPRA